VKSTKTRKGHIIAALRTSIRKKASNIKESLSSLLRLVNLTKVISNKYTLLMAFFVYIYGMFIGPLIVRCDWAYIQSVWDRWQSFNVGVLALISSVLVFKATKYHSEQTRERQFKAARAMLPDALSELTAYLKSAARSLDELWDDYEQASLPSDSDFEIPYPLLPVKARETIKECISNANEDVGDYLARILSNLQVFDARLSGMCEECKGQYRVSPSANNVNAAMILAAKIHALIGNIFEFSRGRKEFSTIELELHHYMTAYALLNLEVGMGLDKYTDLTSMTVNSINSTEGVFSL
tara:strand:- start:169 stop:1056 length:888 start_codon:yes stop_codon:yes gene_type:complete